MNLTNSIDPCGSTCKLCVKGACSACVDNAYLDYDRNCVCKENFSGEFCEVRNMYKGICDPRCEGQCTGPTNHDCLSCTTHAALDMSGNCVCDNYWSGARCSTYAPRQYTCDPKCLNGCDGPDP